MSQQNPLTRFYTQAWSRYGDFSGRSSRGAYWWFALANALVQFAFGFVHGILGTGLIGSIIGLIGALYTLVAFIPSLAVAVRRLHDTDRSGWWLFISLLPVIGWIWIFVLMVLPSIPGQNRFGITDSLYRS